MSRACCMPAEFDPLDALWMTWPHNAADYTPKAACVPWVYAEMLRVLAGRERVRLLVQDAALEQKVRALLASVEVPVDAVLEGTDGEPWLEFFQQPTDRAWARDYLPSFCRRADGGLDAVHFRFTGWALYPNHLRDIEIPPALAAARGWNLVPAIWNGRHVALEGGGIDSNGRGALLTTEECYLDPAVQIRNPGFTRQDYEGLFRQYLGIEKTIWLGHGIAGDDTHGHVDDLCRFVSPDTVVLAQESNVSDINYKPLAENFARLQGETLQDGSALRVIPLPMPDPLVYKGRRLPASYANFAILNRTILVPTFNSPKDRVALGILAELFPGRQVVGVHAGDLILGYGAIHCLSHEEPAGILR
ncbi:agmatine deiminase family protein [Megalodesulfovibrio paquesii]